MPRAMRGINARPGPKARPDTPSIRLAPILHKNLHCDNYFTRNTDDTGFWEMRARNNLPIHCGTQTAVCAGAASAPAPHAYWINRAFAGSSGALSGSPARQTMQHFRQLESPAILFGCFAPRHNQRS